ncbi:uncharacterized protein LOC141597501 [Silene latifolia]|uniref:uncharacterized protein LOC141597501 n=1 Tax=Silene latifolia TaxID=37657 RepID=UPI003D76F73C
MPENSEVNTTIGPEDPHFIHHSDIPGIKLVGTVFDGTGYGGWKRAMLIALSAKNKLGFIDGSLPKPAATDSSAKSWQRCNDIVFSWILNSCSPDIGKSILYSNTAEIAWSELEDRFGQSNGAQLYGAQKKLTDFSQGNDSISTYFTKLKSIWDEVDRMGMNPPCSCNCQCGAKIKQKKFQEDQKIIQFLMGLNDSFAIVRGTILMQNPLPKLSSIYNNLLQEEGQREIHNTVNFQSDSAALYAGNNKGTYRNNYGGNNSYNGYRSNNNNSSAPYNQRNFSTGFKNTNTGYNNQTNPNNVRGNYQQYSQQDTQRSTQQGFNNKGKVSATDVPNAGGLFCNYCKKFNHRIENCKHLQNRNRRFAANVFNDQDGFQSDPAGLNSSSAANSGSTPADSASGFPFVSTSSANFAGMNDSGPSDGPASSANFAGASDHMCSNKALFSDFRTLDKPYSISLPNGNVVFIDTVGSVPITSDLCLGDVLYDYSKRHLVLGRNYNDLYLLTNDKQVVPDVTPNKISSNSVVATANCNVWHHRLGHLPLYKLKQICTVSSDNENALLSCSICAKARQHRLSFSSSTSVSLEPFELIHIDLWGPYHTSTYNGYKYFLTIVDDFTRCTWTHLLTCKGNAFVFVKSFINMVATQFDRKVKTIRSDNAFELGTSHLTSQFLTDHGIIHQTSCFHTPQQNGTVERKHKHLLETARTLSFQSNLPTKYWGECILTATYIIIRLPTKVLQNLSPYQVLFGKEPDLSHMRAFGWFSLCFIS